MLGIQCWTPIESPNGGSVEERRSLHERLNRLGIVKTFLLDDLSHDGESWADFLSEVFHYTVRITAARITMPDKAND